MSLCRTNPAQMLKLLSKPLRLRLLHKDAESPKPDEFAPRCLSRIGWEVGRVERQRFNSKHKRLCRKAFFLD